MANKKITDLGTLESSNGSTSKVLANVGGTLGWMNTSGLVADLEDTVETLEEQLALLQASGGTVNQTYAEELYAYGVQWDVTASDPTCTRIGNTTYHKTLPVQSLMKGGLMDDDGNFTPFADQTDWTQYDRSGESGQVMVRIPAHYRKAVTDGDTRELWLSLVAVSGYTYIPEMYISAYEAALDRTNLKLCSVVNEDEQYVGGRGASNQATFAEHYSDWSLYGRPATYITTTTFRTYARNRGTGVGLNGYGWNCYTYNAHKALLWLFVVEYATRNCQLDYNAELTDDGYHQGGLGAGFTEKCGTYPWMSFNWQSPIAECGYTDSLGNQSGSVEYTLPFGLQSVETTSATDTSFTYVLYKGVFSEQDSYTAGYYYSDGDDLYKCITDCESGVDITDTDYFTQQTRWVTHVPRYRGIEHPFGHIWKRMDGAIAYGTDNQLYTCDDPSLFSSTSYDDYTYKGTFSTSSGYVTDILFGEDADYVPTETGGSDTTYWCDRTSTDATDSLRCLEVGGAANYGSAAGLAYVYTYYAFSNAYRYVGTRLCFFPA